LWDNPVKIYTSGYHYNIHPGRVWWFGYEEYKDDIIKVFSKINTLTNDDYYYDINIKTFEDTWKILTNEINENQIIIQKLELENDEIIKYETMELLVNRVNRNIQEKGRGIIESKIDEHEKKFYFYDSWKNSKGNPVFYDVNDINISEYEYRDPNTNYSNSPNNLKMRNNRRIIDYCSKKMNH